MLICPCHKSKLQAGALTAHTNFRLSLLGSPPDEIHGIILRKTRLSTFADLWSTTQ